MRVGASAGLCWWLRLLACTCACACADGRGSPAPADSAVGMALGPIAGLVAEIAEHLHGGYSYEAAEEQAERAVRLRTAWEGMLSERGEDSRAAQAADCLK